MKRRAFRPLLGRRDRLVSQLRELREQMEAELDAEIQRSVQDVLRQLRDREAGQ